MENSRGLPVAGIVVAVLLALLTIVSYRAGEAADIFHLSELEIAYVAVAVGLVIFGLQGLISVLVEGRRCSGRPRRRVRSARRPANRG